MNKTIYVFLLIILITALSGCRQKGGADITKEQIENGGSAASTTVTLSSVITELENGISAVQFDGDYSFDKFLEQGGASSDSEVMQFLAENITGGNIAFNSVQNIFGCSTLSVKGMNNEMLFGRNFDWNKCEALVVMSKPENSYQSISTVNTDFIKSRIGRMYDKFPDKVKTIASLYAPLDGMNEKGLCVSVNMIQDSATVNQNTDKPDITTSTAIRLLLDKAADTNEALTLLQQYDFHASMGMMIHFAIADTNGKSVAVEYINNEMQVIETPVVTNFYLMPGEKYGIGTEQSHERFNILTDRLEQSPNMTMDEVRSALDSVSKDNFNEFESTEWSVIYNQATKEVRYYHRENYANGYVFYIE